MKTLSTIIAFCRSQLLLTILSVFLVLFPLERVFSQAGRALDFDGVNDRVSLPLAFSGSYTKEVWVKPTAASLAAFSPNLISGDQTALYIKEGRLTAGHPASTFNDVQDADLLLADTWYHVAVTYDAVTDSMKLYKNGAIVDSAGAVSEQTETQQYLGSFFGANFFGGQMDEVRIWSSARSEADISSGWNCELTGDEPFLLAYYNFNQGTASGNNTGLTTLTDSQDKCTAALHGTLLDFTLTGSASNWVEPGGVTNTFCAAFPNINLLGNLICIANADLTPSLADHTIFENYTNTPVSRTFTIQNTGGSTLSIGSVIIGGANASDFSVTSVAPSTIAANSSATFTVSFSTAVTATARNATVTIISNDADEVSYVFAIEGIKADVGKSLDFDGIDDKVDLPFVISGSYTKEAWIKTNTIGGTPNILSGNGTALYLDNGRLAAGHATLFNQLIDGTVLNINTWYHVAVTYDSSSGVMKLYRDGAFLTQATGVPAYTESELKIGSFFGGFYFWGRMDQVRIWSSVRTDIEIANAYNCKISGDEPNLLAWYNFTNGYGGANNAGLNILQDLTDNCSPKNGTLTGFELNGSISNWVADSVTMSGNCGATFANIKLEGNNVCITNGDTTATTADYTDFGSQSAAGADRVFTIVNTGTAALNIGAISFTGADNTMFTVSAAPAATVAPGASNSFTVHFAPIGLGLKTATVTLINDDADETPFSFKIQGTAIEAAFIITNIVATADAAGTATITWTTDVAANSAVSYGIAANNLDQVSSDAALVTNHSIQLTGLTAGTTYYFRVSSTDAANNTITEPAQPAAPLSFTLPPFISLQPANQAVCEGSVVTFSSAATSDISFTAQWQISTDNGISWQDSTGATDNTITFTTSDADDGKQFRVIWTNAGGTAISDTAILTVNDTTSSLTNVSVCNNLLPYNWNGVDYSTSGTYTIVLPAANVNGCDSTATLNLTVTDTSFSITNLSVCNNLLPYNWNGVDYTASGTYTIVLPAANVNGCDSTATLNLMVTDTSFSVTNVSVCNNLLPYNWNGEDYTASGTYTIVLPAANINGCDSTATLNLTVTDTSFSVTNVSVCNNLLPYNWNGVDYSTSGIYTIVLPAANINGCDSTATLNLMVTDTSFSVTNVSVCNNLLPYNWNGVDYSTSGIYTIVLPAANINGCDSTATLNLTVTDTSFSVTNVSVCNNLLPYNWNGVDYSTSGTYTILLPAANVNGCDSTATLNLTVTDTSFSVTNVSVCNNLLPYNWNGVDYTASGTYTIVLPAANVNGCDSTVTLNLTVTDTSFSVTNVSVCNNFLPYNWNGVDYNASGTYTAVLPAANVNGCDSTTTLNLTVTDTSFSVTNVSVCNNLLPYNWNGVDYNASGTYTIVLPGANVNDCDSTATLNLTVTDTSFSVTNVSVCNNLLPYNWNGVDYTASGTYTIVLPAANVNGCDSTATLNLTVTDTSFSVTNVTVCNNLLPYNWNGVDYNASGTYTAVLPGANVNGCDSTATLNLTVTDTSFSVTNVTVCNNLLPYNWNGVDYTASGTHTIVLPAANVNGCDSTATLNLTVTDTSFSVTNVSVCNNLLPYNWNGVDYTASGTYTIVLPGANINGCDSTATLNLTVLDTSFSVTNVSVCNNLLPYNWNGTDYTASGTYTIVLPAANVNGCDSTATLNLTVTSIGVSIVKQNLVCLENSDGSFTASGTSGTAPYEFSIDGGTIWQSSGTFSNLTAGTYTLTTRDASGCSKDSAFEITVDKAQWLGTVSNDWHTPANWSTGQVPTSVTHVIISATAQNECVVSTANAAAASIQANTGSAFKIENNRELLISGTCSTLPVD